MKLYRYLDARWGVQSVLDGYFKLSKPSEFNDPLDCAGSVRGQPDPKVIQKYIREKKLVGRFRAADLLSGCDNNWSEADIEEKYLNDYNKQFTMLCLDKRSVDRFVSLLCFANAEELTSDADILMWSHYADKGNGVRITFEFDDDYFNRGIVVESVKYLSKLPQLDATRITDMLDVNQVMPFFRERIWRKGVAWEYEKEVRFDVAEPLLGGSVIRRDGISFLQVPRRYIKCIDFGPMMMIAEGKKYAKQLKGKPATSLIQLRMAVFDGQYYRYNYVPIEE